MAASLRRYHLMLTLAGLAMAVPLVIQYFGPGDALHDVSGHQYGRDFINSWGGATLAMRGAVMTLFDYKAYYDALEALYGAAIPFHNWSYPPHILPLLAPLAMLPYAAALAVWTLGGFALYAAAVVDGLPQPSRGRAMTLALLALAPATLVNAVTGQNGFFTAAILLTAIRWFDARPYLAGVLLGVLTVKPHLGIVIGVIALAQGRWRVVAGAAASAALLVGSTLPLWGLDPWIGFFTKTMALTRFYFEHFEGFYTYMMPSVFASGLLMGLPMGIAMGVQVAVGIAVVVAAVIAWRATTDLALRAMIVAAGTLLASPYAFNYDMTLLTGALLWLFARRDSLDGAERWAYGAAFVLPVAIWPLHLWGLSVAPLILGGAFVLAWRQATERQRIAHATGRLAPAAA